MAVLYGLLNEQDLAAQRVTTVGVRQVFDAIDQSVAEHDRVMASLMGLFTRPTTEFQVQYETAASIRLQPLDNRPQSPPATLACSGVNAWNCFGQRLANFGADNLAVRRPNTRVNQHVSTMLARCMHDATKRVTMRVALNEIQSERIALAVKKLVV